MKIARGVVNDRRYSKHLTSLSLRSRLLEAFIASKEVPVRRPAPPGIRPFLEINDRPPLAARSFAPCTNLSLCVCVMGRRYFYYHNKKRKPVIPMAMVLVLGLRLLISAALCTLYFVTVLPQIIIREFGNSGEVVNVMASKVAWLD